MVRRFIGEGCNDKSGSGSLRDKQVPRPLSRSAWCVIRDELCTVSYAGDNLDLSYQEHPVTDVADAAIATSLAAAMAVPLWVALEVIGWGKNVLLN